MIELEIYGLAYGGAGVGKLDGKVCFVEGALPGEKVRFEKGSEKSRFIVGRASEILTPSEHRVKPVCPYYGRCGGCQYQHLSYDKEVHYKAEQVREILGRIGGLRQYEFAGITASPLDYGYRSSITIHASPAGYGYFGNDNKTIIPIERCPLAEEPINRAIATLDASQGREDVTIKSDTEGNAWVSGRPGNRFYTDKFLDTPVTLSPMAFSQTNRRVACAMVEWLRGLLKEKSSAILFDLYCGTGFFGILLRDLFGKVIGIDHDGVAIDCAKNTKKGLAAENTVFYRAEDRDFASYYDKTRERENAILIDPPRSGLNNTFVSWLAGLKDARILYYISCNPATLARDAKMLCGEGAWKLGRVACFDMFPRTMHVETIVVFER